MITVEQLKALLKRLEALRGYLELDKKAIEIQNEEEKTQAPEFWNDPSTAEKILKLIKTKKNWIEEYQKVENAFDDLTVLREFFEQLCSAQGVPPCGHHHHLHRTPRHSGGHILFCTRLSWWR